MCCEHKLKISAWVFSLHFFDQLILRLFYWSKHIREWLCVSLILCVWFLIIFWHCCNSLILNCDFDIFLSNDFDFFICCDFDLCLICYLNLFLSWDFDLFLSCDLNYFLIYDLFLNYDLILIILDLILFILNLNILFSNFIILAIIDLFHMCCQHKFEISVWIFSP